MKWVCKDWLKPLPIEALPGRPLVNSPDARVLLSSVILLRCSMCAWESNRSMPHPKNDPAHEELLSVLRSAKNRLEHLTPNDWTLIVDRTQKAVFKRGESLIKQGKQTKKVFLLVRGHAKVEAFPKAFIAVIGPGEICGEMAFLDNGIASATVTAEDDVEACAIEWSALSDLFELFPHLGSRFYRSLAVSLSRRMRDQIGIKQIASKPI